MAYGVKGAALQIHQTLHGYADGHRQLAASLSLKPGDVKAMLVLSDISGSGARIHEKGYLTGYPLFESKMYALARTWAAPEMPRPGCVWTHTLLIDFADLATLNDPTTLLSLFCQPSKMDIADYENPLSIFSEDSSAELSSSSLVFARKLLVGLYEKPHSRVIVTRPADFDVDLVVMAVWAQQWPRLRRAFRFCTLSVSDRSTGSNAFDLQFLPSLDRSVRSRFHGVLEINDRSVLLENWIDDAVSDLAHTDIGGLRTFLRRIGGDVDSWREAFRSLCRLHVLIQEFQTNPESINRAILLLENELGSVQARAAREIVFTAAFEQGNRLDDAAFDFIIRHLEFAESGGLSINSGILCREIWRRSPDRFIEMLEGSERQRLISSEGFAALEMAELINGIVRKPSFAPIALTHRPELVVWPEFWSSDLVSTDTAFTILATKSHLRTRALLAMIMANRQDLARRAAYEIGHLEVLQAIAAFFDSLTADQQNLREWFSAAISNSEAVAQFLADGQMRSWELLSAIAHLMHADAVPNDYGTDPWLVAIRASSEPFSKEESIFLYSYLLSRALGSQSRNPGELVQISFDPVYMAASIDHLPDHEWYIIENKLPWSYGWFPSDRCQRIREAVGELFVSRELSPQLFAKITSNDQAFVAMTEIIARSNRGRRFLKRVSRCLKSEGMQYNIVRIAMIEKTID